jgi:GNAT superfamily N-acetyltransferase
MSDLTVMLADTPTLKREVYRFRYKIYIEQMKRRQIYADHGARLVEEPMDASARNYIAFKGDAPVGIIRANMADDPAMAYYRKLYRIDALGVRDVAKVQITTKLMVRPDLRNTAIGPRMIQHYADQAYRLGVEADLIDCNKPLMPFFERMGYFSYCGWVFHKEYGTVRPMIFAVDTVDYMDTIHSILVTPAKSRIKDGCYGGYELIRRIAEPPSGGLAHAAYVAAFIPMSRVAAAE